MIATLFVALVRIDHESRVRPAATHEHRLAAGDREFAQGVHELVAENGIELDLSDRVVVKHDRRLKAHRSNPPLARARLGGGRVSGGSAPRLFEPAEQSLAGGDSGSAAGLPGHAPTPL
jgi:hypothetical protein